MTPDSPQSQRFFRSARGLSAFFWATLIALVGNWVAGIAQFSVGAALFLRCLFVVPLLLGLVTMRAAMAGMRESGTFGAFSALTVALAGLSPFWGFWETHPGTGYFAWNAIALCVVWLLWLVMACRLCRRYARDLGTPHLATEAAVASVMVLMVGIGIAGLACFLLIRDARVVTAENLLLVFDEIAVESRFLVSMPFLLTAYTLWLAKEAGFRSLMAPRDP